MSEQSNSSPHEKPPASSPASASPAREGGRTSQPPPAPPKSSSPLKTIIPIAALAAVVFGITLLSQYSERTPDDKRDDKKSSASNEKALYLPESIRYYSPYLDAAVKPEGAPELSLNYVFPGYYEPGETWNRAAFWLENRNAAPVAMQLTKMDGGPGCSQCISARLAPIPEDTADLLAFTSALSGVPQGMVCGLPLAFAGAAANLAPDRLQWQQFDSGIPNPSFQVPAKPQGKRDCPYQWSILELLFKVKESGMPKKPIEAEFTLKVDGTEITQNTKMTVGYAGADPFESSAVKLEFGEITETSDPRTMNFLVYSSTRGPKKLFQTERQDLAAPSVRVSIPGSEANAGSFVSVGEAVRVPESRLPQLQDEATRAHKYPVRVESAYSYSVTLNPKPGDQRIDLGVFDREIALSLPGMAQPKLVRVRALVRGSVWLANNRTEIELPSYRSSDGLIQTVKIVTENRDAVLRLAPEECRPKFVAYQLTKLPAAPDYGYHELRVEIPKNSQAGTWSGSVVLELAGPKPQRIRIPIRGAAKF
jgi:hypothetical protein